VAKHGRLEHWDLTRAVIVLGHWHEGGVIRGRTIRHPSYSPQQPTTRPPPHSQSPVPLSPYSQATVYLLYLLQHARVPVRPAPTADPPSSISGQPLASQATTPELERPTSVNSTLKRQAVMLRPKGTTCSSMAPFVVPPVPSSEEAANRGDLSRVDEGVTAGVQGGVVPARHIMAELAYGEGHKGHVELYVATNGEAWLEIMAFDEDISVGGVVVHAQGAPGSHSQPSTHHASSIRAISNPHFTAGAATFLSELVTGGKRPALLGMDAGAPGGGFGVPPGGHLTVPGGVLTFDGVVDTQELARRQLSGSDRDSSAPPVQLESLELERAPAGLRVLGRDTFTVTSAAMPGSPSAVTGESSYPLPVPQLPAGRVKAGVVAAVQHALVRGVYRGPVHVVGIEDCGSALPSYRDDSVCVLTAAQAQLVTFSEEDDEAEAVRGTPGALQPALQAALDSGCINYKRLVVGEVKGDPFAGACCQGCPRGWGR